MRARSLTLIAAFVAMLGSFAAIAFAIRRFDAHPGLPSHIGVGTQWGHVVPGEPDRVNGQAIGARASTKLLLDAQEAPYESNHWGVIDSVDRLGPGGSFSFVIHPRVRTRYKVISAVDHLNMSRAVAVIVDPAPRPRHR